MKLTIIIIEIIKKDIIQSIHGIPLSFFSNTRNTEILTRVYHFHLIHGLSDTDCYSLAMNESCDNTDVKQLCIFQDIWIIPMKKSMMEY